MDRIKNSKIKIVIPAIGLILILFPFLTPTLHARTARQIDAEVNEALKIFSRQVRGGREFLQAAKGVLVIPNMIKAGFGVGGEYGEGALRIDEKTVDYYSFAAGSIGFQIGAQKLHLILIFMEDEALRHFRRSSGWKAGVDGSVTFIDIGKRGSVDTVNIKEPIIAFVFGQKGLMASATVEGAKFTKLVR
jgi:lipid-binding SYLF domain-containing protein